MATTLLTQVNNILILLNEQTVETVNESNTSLKVKRVFEQAVRKMVMLNNAWPWLQSEVNAISWTVDKALLDTSVLDTRFIRYNNDRAVCYIDNKEYFTYARMPGEPRFYTRIGDAYYLYPYPDTISRQNATKFHVVQLPGLPQADARLPHLHR